MSVDYGEMVVSWLREHFPHWSAEHGNRTHCAAIAAVIRIQGRGEAVSMSRHGAEIRAAVKHFEKEVAG